MKGLYKMRDLIMDINRKIWLGYMIKMDKTKVTKKREKCVFLDTRLRILIAIEVSQDSGAAIIRLIREEKISKVQATLQLMGDLVLLSRSSLYEKIMGMSLVKSPGLMPIFTKYVIPQVFT